MGGTNRWTGLALCIPTTVVAMGLVAALGAQPLEADADGAARVLGPPNQGLALSASLVPWTGGTDGGLALRLAVANASEGPLVVPIGPRSGHWTGGLVYTGRGECVLPASTDGGVAIPGPRGGGPIGPTEPTVLAPGATIAVDCYGRVLEMMPRDTPPGPYSLIVLAIAPSKGISSLLVSNLVTFDWPRAAE